MPGAPRGNGIPGAGPQLLIMAQMEADDPLETLITAADRALRSLLAPHRAARPLPQPPAPQAAEPGLSPYEERRAAALMRVNHAGEIAAQALYHGQALVARSEATRELLLKAAREEADHLAWCETRLAELRARPSLLNPLWYVGSLTIGALAALAGDRASLGFVVETERQVEGHLDQHLGRLPPADLRSRAILQAMRSDEAAHGATARAAGGAELPTPVRALMRMTARCMTSAAYWV
jgi:ubiquinone biosynthesis monooxygenase Coq7